MAVSRQSRAAPRAPKTIPKRASFRQDSGPRRPATSGSTASAGSRTSSSTSSEVTDARSESLRPTLGAENPGVSVGTTKPRTLVSVWAQTTATSATEPLVIHILVPFSTQSSPSRLAWVRMPAGLEPKSASVSPKQPIASPVAIGGNQVVFCSSLPNFQIANMAREPCTDTMLRTPESPASSSRQANPYETALAPAQP
jgi:hypothetical protein